jgi:DNA-binding CsgD family transcriptional regulator
VLDERIPPLVRHAVRPAEPAHPPESPRLLELHRLAVTDLAEDRFEAARAHAREGVQLAARFESPAAAAHHHALLAWAEALLGRESECREHARAAFQAASTHDLDVPWHLATLALGEVELGLGHNDEALAHLEDVWETAAIPFLRLLAAPCLVEAAMRADGRELALEVTAAYAELRPPEALLARCRALVGGAEAEFDRAIALHLANGDRFETARTRLLYGELLRRDRRRRDARAHLLAAREGFEKLGASTWAERAATELRGSGATARRSQVDRLHELTAQELQVARLVAAGATNKQVAGQLFLSPRTIDFHLRNVFAKLGITSRIQLSWFALPEPAPGDFAGAIQRQAA